MLNVFLLSHRLSDSLVSNKTKMPEAEDIVVIHLIRDGNDIKNTCFNMFIISKVSNTSIFLPIKRNAEINNEELDIHRYEFYKKYSQ